MARRNDRPMFEMTSEMLANIINYPLCDPESPIVLIQLSNEDAESARIVRNARYMLDALSQGPQKLTEKMHLLNRRFVRAMFEQLEFEEGFAEIRRDWTTLDEDQLWQLSALRDVMQIAGLLRVLHGKVLITKRGQQLRDPQRAGDLHHLLFTTYFLRYNIAATDRYPEDPEMQHHLAFMLFRFGTLLREPMAVVEFSHRLPHNESIWLDCAVHSEYHADANWELHGALARRILEPLVDFGLLTWKAGVPAKDKDLAALREYTVRQWRITPLFNRFVALSHGERLVGLGDVVVPAPPGAPKLAPADKQMSVRESIEQFSRQTSEGDVAMEQALAGHLMMLELAGAAPFLSAAGGSKTPVERVIAEIPRLMRTVSGGSKSGPETIAVIAAVFASYVAWCVQMGQARHEVGARVLASLEKWLPEDVLDEMRSSLN